MLFNRALLKQNAKFCLKRYYWLALAVTLIVSFVGGFSGQLSLNFNFGTADTSYSYSTAEAMESVFSSGNISAILIAVVISIAVFLFLSIPLSVGMAHFFLKSRECEAKIDYIGYAYKNCLGTTIGTMFCMYVYIFLWTMLAMVPYIGGIALLAVTENPLSVFLVFLSFPLMYFPISKEYEYSMIPYLLAENPNMTRQRAFQLSKQMTNGYKGNLFVLQLSFLGWIYLGLLCCCIGVIFVVPYMQATWAEAYTFLKSMAKTSGYTNDAELPGFAPVVPQAPVAQAVAQAPVAQAPVVEAPVAQDPIVEAPVAQTVAETPIVESPVAETVIEAPVVEAPIAQTVIEAPVIEQPTIADIPEMPEMPEINQGNGTIEE